MSNKGDVDRDDGASQPPAPQEPAHEREKQEHAESRGTPEKSVEVGQRRTVPPDVHRPER